MQAVLLQSPGRHRVPLQEGFSCNWSYQQYIKKKIILPTQFTLLVFRGAVKREVWLYCKPWALHFVLFLFLETHLSYRRFLHFVALFLVTKFIFFFRSHRPAAKRGTSIIVAASNPMIFAIRSASDLIHRKRLLRGCFLLLLQGFRAACHYYFFLDVQIVLESK